MNNSANQNIMFQQKLKPLFSSLLLTGHIYPRSLPSHQCSINWELTDLYGSDTTYIKQLINDEQSKTNLANNRIDYYKEINDLISDPDRINWSQMSANPSAAAIDLLSKNPHKIEWRKLIRENTNPRVWELMKDYPEHMEKYADSKYGKDNFQLFLHTYLSKRPENNAIEYLLEYFPDNINYCNLSKNICERALDLLIANPSKINWSLLSFNSNERAIDLLIANPTKINFDNLRHNPNDRAFDLLIVNHKKINWIATSANTGDWAIDLLDCQPKKIDWYCLCRNKNPRVIDLLIKHKKWFDKYVLKHELREMELTNDVGPKEERYYYERHESSLLQNLMYRPEIFEFDYKNAVNEKHIQSGLFSELIANRLHPKNIPKFFGWGFEDFIHYS